MTADVVGVLAEAIAQHGYDYGYCRCGWKCDIDVPEMNNRQHARHVASVVAALPNIAIVPVIRGDWEPGRWWRVIAPDTIVWCETSDELEARAAIRDGDVLERLFDGPHLREWRAVAGGQG